MVVEYAERLGLTDQDGRPLLPWTSPEDAYEEFKQLTNGRPCDYTEITYERLRGGSGIQWGGERLYTDHVFNTAADYCESYGHDLISGAENEPDEYRAHDPRGRAVLKSAEYVPSPEQPDDEYPFVLNTGRSVYHWHTRTKTARAPELERAAPEVWVELAPEDAAELELTDGDVVRVESARGWIEAPVRLKDSTRGVVFVPFHYGYWDDEGKTAANELTITRWDPVSKQPIYKTAAVRIEKVREATPRENRGAKVTA
jgi:anaerobic selenocysteine-containing dehydrogenase